MTCIHEYKVNKLFENFLLDDILNPPKCAKNLNIHYSPILQECMNTRKGK